MRGRMAGGERERERERESVCDEEGERGSRRRKNVREREREREERSVQKALCEHERRPILCDPAPRGFKRSGEE